MPKHVQARAAQDEQEERRVRKLAGSLHAPADGKFHAQMVVQCKGCYEMARFFDHYLTYISHGFLNG